MDVASENISINMFTYNTRDILYMYNKNVHYFQGIESS